MLLSSLKWKFSQQQHLSKMQLGHSNYEGLTLQCSIQSAHFKVIIKNFPKI